MVFARDGVTYVLHGLGKIIPEQSYPGASKKKPRIVHLNFEDVDPEGNLRFEDVGG